MEEFGLTRSKRNGLTGYTNAEHLPETHRPHYLTYGGGYSVGLSHSVDQTVYLGNQKVRQPLWVSNYQPSAFHNSYGTVGTMGAELSSPAAKQLGQFYMVPRPDRIDMFVGPFKHGHRCRSPMQMAPISPTGRQQGRWQVRGWVGIVGAGRSRTVRHMQRSMSAELMLDTGMSTLELEPSLWWSFASMMAAVGSPLSGQADYISYAASNCANHAHRFPRIWVKIGGTVHYIRPKDYVVVAGCRVRVMPKPEAGGISSPGAIVLGPNLLRRVVSVWDASGQKFGFCRLIQ